MANNTKTNNIIKKNDMANKKEKNKNYKWHGHDHQKPYSLLLNETFPLLYCMLQHNMRIYMDIGHSLPFPQNDNGKFPYYFFYWIRWRPMLLKCKVRY